MGDRVSAANPHHWLNITISYLYDLVEIRVCNRTLIRRCEIAIGACAPPSTDSTANRTPTARALERPPSASPRTSGGPTRPAGWERRRGPDRRRGRANSTPPRIAVRRAERRSARASTGSVAWSSRGRTRPRSLSTTAARPACPRTDRNRDRVRGRNRRRARARTPRAAVRSRGTGPTVGESPPRGVRPLSTGRGPVSDAAITPVRSEPSARGPRSVEPPFRRYCRAIPGSRRSFRGFP